MVDERREMGRDGVTGLLSQERFVRAREVSRPTPDDVEAAAGVVDQLVARARGQKRR